MKREGGKKKKKGKEKGRKGRKTIVGITTFIKLWPEGKKVGYRS